LQKDTKRIKAIFFDLDGTLTDYEASVDYAMARLWERIKHVCPLPLEDFLSAQWEFLEDLEEREYRGEIPRKLLKDRGLRMEEFFRSLEPALLDHLPDIGEQYTCLRRERIQLFPDTEATLAALSKGYALGVITEGTGPNQRGQIKKTGIGHYFEHVVISDEVGLHKPEPAIFLKACEMASVRPEEAALIGDRVDWDILPAQKAGMLTVLSKQQKHYGLRTNHGVEPDYTITRFDELTDIFPVSSGPREVEL